MKKFMLILTMVLYFGFIPACRDQKSPAESYSGPVTGDLKITFVSPQGPAEAPHETETLVVMFSHPMIPLGAIDEWKNPDFLQISPRVKGNSQWLNPKTLVFTPDKKLPSATEFQATVIAETQSFQGHYLENDFTWTFQTAAPEIIRHNPEDGRKWIPLEPNIWLFFNMPVSSKKAEEFISIVPASSTSEKSSSLSFSVKHPSGDFLQEKGQDSNPEQVLMIKPEPLAPGRTYSVEIRAGLPAEEGHLGMRQSRSFSFSTFFPFQFSKLETGHPHNPERSLKLHFSNPVSYSKLVEKLSLIPEVEIPSYYDAWNQDETILYLSLPLKPETEYSLFIDPGLEDRFGNKLNRKISRKFKTSSYPPSLEINTGNGFLEYYGDRKFPIYSMNTPRVRIQAAQVTADEVIPILSERRIFRPAEPYSPENFYQMDRTLSLNSQKNIRTVTPFDLDLLLKENPGWIFLQLDTRSQQKWNRYPKALLQVTNLGITAKFSPSGNLIWVTTLREGEPVADARVEVRDDKNRVLWKGLTGSQGKIRTPGWRDLGLKPASRWNTPRQWIIVYKNNDSAFTNSEWYSGISPYEFGINYNWSPPAVDITGYIYSDRGIYQAGETVHLKGIIRESTAEGLVIPEFEKAELKIWNPLHQKVFDREISFNKYGTFSRDYTPPEDASLGTYNVTATLTPSENESKSVKKFSGSFRVESFRPAKYELHLKTARESYVFGETYQAAVQAEYLSGGAMSGQNLEWHLRLNPAQYSPPGHEEFTFGDRMSRWDQQNRDESRLLSSGEKKLDDQGKAEISMELKPVKENDSMTSVLEATVQGPDRRRVTGRIQTIVHRGRYYIGLKPSSLFIPKKKGLEAQVVTVSPEGKPAAGKDIQIKLLMREWHSVRKSTIGGRFRWISEKKDTLIDTRKISSKGRPQTITFQPEKAGFYILKAQGEDKNGNIIRTSTSVYITGKDYIPWQRDNDDAVEVLPNRSHYQPGETAELLIKSPYEKTMAIISVERESILQSRIIEIEGSMHTLRLPIESRHIPNVFVSVILIKGRTHSAPEENPERSDLGKPAFKLGYCQLNIDPEEKKLSVDLETERKTYHPGDKVKLSFRVTGHEGTGEQAEVSIAVADVGVLNLIGFQTPDPFSRFYRRRPLSVHTAETRRFVISRIFTGEKGENAHGAVGESGAPGYAELSEVLLRKNFRPLAYWNPDLLTGKDGRGEVEFTLPDNLTKFRVMIVALTKNSRFGHGHTDFQVNKPLLLRPSLPRFARFGDRFRAGVVVQNHSSSTREVTLQGSARGIAMPRSGQKHTLQLPAGESREILFDYSADQPGKAHFIFKAVMGQYSDGLEAEIPIQIPRQPETSASFNQTDSGSSEILLLPETAYPQYSHLEIYASPSAITGIQGGLRYLKEYPYLCLEQRISSILPFLVAEDIIRDFSLTSQSPEEYQNTIRETLSQIPNYQTGDGGFSFWAESQISSPFLTCYTAFCLIQAEKSGYSISSETLTQALDYLTRTARDKVSFRNHPYSPTTRLSVRAYALYLLALSGRPEPAYTEKLYVERDQLSSFAKAMLIKAMHYEGGYPEAKQILMNALMNKIKISPARAHFETGEGRKGAWIYSSDTRTTALVLQTLLELEIHNDFIPAMARWLISRRQAGHWSSTQDNFFAFYALNQYYRLYEDPSPDFNLKVNLNGEKLLQNNITQVADTVRKKISLNRWDAGSRKKLQMNKSGPGTLYYETRLSYVSSRPEEPRDRGFSIQKQFLTLEGKPLSEFKAGQMVIVSLRVITPQERLFVAVNDPLPAGMEAVHPDFEIESREMQRKMQQWAGRTEKKSPSWRGFNHTEIHRDRILLFADSLAPGIHYHHYLARILLPGEFTLPGTRAEEMYTPEVFGRNGEKRIIVHKP